MRRNRSRHAGTQGCSRNDRNSEETVRLRARLHPEHGEIRGARGRRGVPVTEATRAARAVRPPSAPVPAAVQEVRWRIEELRVSLFAQELGTAMRISDARIYRALDEARG